MDGLYFNYFRIEFTFNILISRMCVQMGIQMCVQMGIMEKYSIRLKCSMKMKFFPIIS